MNNERMTTITVHSGNFHADEVFACAALSLVFGGKVVITRSRDPKVWEVSDIVADVGSMYDPATDRFDHHQEGGAGVRENGIPYASFGLVWKKYGERLAGSAYAARVIDEGFVQAIDAEDNGVDICAPLTVVEPSSIHHVVSAFRPAWNEERTFTEGFFEALSFAKRILEREIVRGRAEEEGVRRTEEAYAHAGDKKIILLDRSHPWQQVLRQYPEPLFVVAPGHEDETWNVLTVRESPHSFKNRKDLPDVWAGKAREELAAITGVPDAIFCHNKRFLCVAGSKESAIKLAKLAVEVN